MWGGSLQKVYDEYIKEEDIENLSFDGGTITLKKIGRTVYLGIIFERNYTFSLTGWEMKLLLTLPEKYQPLLNYVPSFVLKKENSSISQLYGVFLNVQRNGNLYLQNGEGQNISFSGGGRCQITYFSKKPE